MQAEDLKGWLAAARRDETEREKRIKDGGDREDAMAPTEAEGHWGRVVEIIQTTFQEGELAEESTWQAPREARRNALISAETWRLVDERVATRRDPRYCQADRRTLGRKIGRSLARDRKRRTEEAGAAVEALMKAEPPLTQ